MTTITPAQATESTRPEPGPKPAAALDDLAFATMLAETVRQETESMLLSTETSGSTSTMQPQMAAFQQLAFLGQPTALSLPSFLFSDWTPPQRSLTPAPLARSAEINPYSSALASLQSAPATVKAPPSVAPVTAAQS